MKFTHKGHEYLITDYIRMKSQPYGYEIHQREDSDRPTYVENTGKVLRRYREWWCEKYGYATDPGMSTTKMVKLDSLWEARKIEEAHDLLRMTVDEALELEREQQADNDYFLGGGQRW